jgi:hypothetical protein
MNLAPFIKHTFTDNNGLPLASGKVYTYAANTTTPLVTYQDADGISQNANPIILDSSGRCNLWLDPVLSYKFVVKDSSDVTLYTVDKVAGSAAGGIPTWNSNSSYSKGDIVSDGTDQGLLYVSRIDSNLNNALSVVADWALFNGIQRSAALTTNTTLAVTDHGGLVRSNSTSGALTHTLPACSTSPIGLTISVKDIGSGGFTTSVKGSGSDTIDGNNNWANSLNQYDSATFRNNGTSWDVV